jgi:hypothetical protein
MLLGMIYLLACLVERRHGAAPVAVDSFLCPSTTSCLSTRNGAGQIALSNSDTVFACVPESTATDAGGWPGSVGPSLRQLWAELAQRQVHIFLIQENRYDDR